MSIYIVGNRYLNGDRSHSEYEKKKYVKIHLAVNVKNGMISIKIGKII